MDRILLLAAANPILLHVLNIAVHGINAALVCVLARTLQLPVLSAVGAGLLFLVFPSSVEAVAWPSAIHDLVVTACALGFLLLSHGHMSRRRVGVAMVILIIALLSKESAIVIPALAAILWFHTTGLRRFHGWQMAAAGAAICILYVAVRLIAAPVSSSYAAPPSRYLLKEMLARSLGTLAMPWANAVVETSPLVVSGWAIAFVVAATVYAWARTRQVSPSVIVRCLIAAIVSVIPVYSLLFITADLENARYIYLSTAFWTIACVGLISAHEANTRLRSSVMLGIAIVIGAVGVQWHLTAWKDAALLRDRVLASAESVIATAPCSIISFADVPDSVRGAYVFRNGLGEALTARTNVRRTERGVQLYVCVDSIFVSADGD